MRTRSMITRSMIAMLLVLAMTLMLGACAQLQPQPSPADQIQMGHDAVSAITQATHDFQAAVHAATQPVTAPDGSVIPGVPIPPKIVNGVDKGVGAVDKGAAATTAGLNAASDPGANAGTFLQMIAPLTGQAAPYVFFGGAVLAYLSKKKSDRALVSTASALQSAAANGSITITPAAVPLINSIVTDHPGTDAIVDALSDAAKTPRI